METNLTDSPELGITDQHLCTSAGKNTSLDAFYRWFGFYQNHKSRHTHYLKLNFSMRHPVYNLRFALLKDMYVCANHTRAG